MVTMFPVNGLMDNAEVDIVLVFIASLKNFLNFCRENAEFRHQFLLIKDQQWVILNKNKYTVNK